MRNLTEVLAECLGLSGAEGLKSSSVAKLRASGARAGRCRSRLSDLDGGEEEDRRGAGSPLHGDCWSLRELA